jgi:hypothetical protein
VVTSSLFRDTENKLRRRTAAKAFAESVGTLARKILQWRSCIYVGGRVNTANVRTADNGDICGSIYSFDLIVSSMKVAEKMWLG